MTRIIRLALLSGALATLSAPLTAHADPAPIPGNVSLGVGLGDPTALDLKIWTHQGSGFDIGVGLHRFSERLGLYLEYELGLVDFWMGDSVMGVFYIGIGGALALRNDSDDTSVALVIPIGANFRFRAPVEIFLEGRPGFVIVNQKGYGFGGSLFGLGGQLGVRYVF